MPRAISSSRSNTLLHIGIIAALIGIPIAVALVSVQQVSTMPVVCLFKRFTGHDCMGCGMTRGVVSLMHGHVEDAIEFNRGVTIVAPLLAWLWARELVRRSRALLSARLAG